MAKVNNVPRPTPMSPELGTGDEKRSTPVTAGQLSEQRTKGVKIRGTGAATKGVMARGPLA